MPAILVRTPYGKGADMTPNYQAFVDHGYAVVVQDVRGRYESEGVFEPLDAGSRRWRRHAELDRAPALVRRQDRHDRRLLPGHRAVEGGAASNNPHLKAIFPVVSGDDDYRDRFYSTGGAMKLGNRLEWMSENLQRPGYQPDFSQFVLHLPLRTADVAATGRVSEHVPGGAGLIRRSTRSGARISTREQLGQVRVPVFAVGGWYDNFVGERSGGLRRAAQDVRA